MNLLEMWEVTKRFGDFVANEDVTFSVGDGEVVGLLGANGAGKTTAIRQALGLVAPTSGSVTQFGRLPSRESRSRIGYVPQGLGLWTDLSVDENLEFAARAYGTGDSVPPADVGVDGGTRVKDLPLGRRRRVAFIAALGHDPELLVLDEPTSGVGPLSRSRLWDVIRSRADTGAGVLVTTHFMDEARQCDRLLVMHEGRIVLRGTYDEIVRGHRVVEVESDDWATVYSALDDAGFGCGVSGTVVRVLGDDISAVEEVLETLDLPVRVATGPATLEETMVDVAKATRGGPGSDGGSTVRQ